MRGQVGGSRDRMERRGQYEEAKGGRDRDKKNDNAVAIVIMLCLEIILEQRNDKKSQQPF